MSAAARERGRKKKTFRRYLYFFPLPRDYSAPSVRINKKRGAK
jgi:hypothetical protein